MTANTYLTLVTIILPIIGGIIGYYINYFFEKQKEINSKVNFERREIYQKFIDLIITLNQDTSNINMTSFNNDLNNFYKKYVLFASPKVINSFTNFIIIINQENKLQVETAYYKSLTKIIYEMRKDLGLSNSNLGKDGEVLLRAIIFKK